MELDKQNKNLKILFVDDNKADTFFTKQIIELDEIPVEPYFEKNGIAALEYLSQCSPEDFPDVVITDVNMPMISGFEFIERFENTLLESHPDTKFFVMSTAYHSTFEEKISGYTCAKGYVEKPFSLELFEEKILPKL